MIEQNAEGLANPHTTEEPDTRILASPASRGPRRSGVSAQLPELVGRAASIIVISLLAGMAVWQGQQGEWPVMAATATFAALAAAELYLRRAPRP